MNFEKRMNKPIVIVLIALMILCSVVPLMADKAFAFSGKIGSEYYTTDGGRITYAPGDGGYSNSRKTDLNDTIGNRYAYCVQPSKISPVVGKMTVDRVITIYSYDEYENLLSFDNHVYRSDVQGTKIGDSTSERLSYVPFTTTTKGSKPKQNGCLL